MDHGFKARFEEPSVKGWHRRFAWGGHCGTDGWKRVWKKRVLKEKIPVDQSIGWKSRFGYYGWGWFPKPKPQLMNKVTSSLVFKMPLCHPFKMVHIYVFNEHPFEQATRYHPLRKLQGMHLKTGFMAVNFWRPVAPMKGPVTLFCSTLLVWFGWLEGASWDNKRIPKFQWYICIYT